MSELSIVNDAFVSLLVFGKSRARDIVLSLLDEDVSLRCTPIPDDEYEIVLPLHSKEIAVRILENHPPIPYAEIETLENWAEDDVEIPAGTKLTPLHRGG